MNTFDSETNAYMENRGYNTEKLKEGNRYGTEGQAGYLGLADLRTRLGYWTNILLIITVIAFGIIIACSGTLFGYIRGADEAKPFYDKHEHLANSTSGIIIGLASILFLALVLYLVYNYSRFLREDAALTDIGRIGLEPLEQTEVHNSLTDLVANRAGLNDYQRAQLRENIGRGIKINNNQAYGNIIQNIKNKYADYDDIKTERDLARNRNSDYQGAASKLRTRIRILEQQLNDASAGAASSERQQSELAKTVSDLPPVLPLRNNRDNNMYVDQEPE